MRLLTGHEPDDDMPQTAGRLTVCQWSSSHSCRPNWLVEVIHASCSQDTAGASFLSHLDQWHDWHDSCPCILMMLLFSHDNFQPAQCPVSVSFLCNVKLRTKKRYLLYRDFCVVQSLRWQTAANWLFLYRHLAYTSQSVVWWQLELVCQLQTQLWPPAYVNELRVNRQLCSCYR